MPGPTKAGYKGGEISACFALKAFADGGIAQNSTLCVVAAAGWSATGSLKSNGSQTGDFDSSGKKPWLYVKTLMGAMLEVDFDLADTVLQLKEKIRSQSGIPENQQRLVFAGTETARKWQEPPPFASEMWR